MNDNQPVVYAGVDTHQDVHVAVVVDTTGWQLACRSFPTSPLGLARLEHWLAGHGRVARVGVEGTGSYGLGAAAGADPRRARRGGGQPAQPTATPGTG